MQCRRVFYCGEMTQWTSITLWIRPLFLLCWSLALLASMLSCSEVYRAQIANDIARSIREKITEIEKYWKNSVRLAQPMFMVCFWCYFVIVADRWHDSTWTQPSYYSRELDHMRRFKNGQMTNLGNFDSFCTCTMINDVFWSYMSEVWREKLGFWKPWTTVVSWETFSFTYPVSPKENQFSVKLLAEISIEQEWRWEVRKKVQFQA